MKDTFITCNRLLTQQVAQQNFKNIKNLVQHMGAIQAQDLSMSKWAIALRTLNASEKSVEKSFNLGEIIRTHVLRPTWHIVAASDIHWMLDLTAPLIKKLHKPRLKELELTDKIISKSLSIFEKSLTQVQHLTRDSLIEALNKANIPTNDSRASHLLLAAELEGLLCSGASTDAKPTYTLLQEWVPKKKQLDREASCATLAFRYFSSHGPATLKDFEWWSGLPLKEARNGLASVANQLQPIQGEEDQYWCNETLATRHAPFSTYLLPTFDEFLISYKNRKASLLFEHHQKTISKNGIFYPTILVNGKVAGLWKRDIKNQVVAIEVTFFKTPDTKMRAHTTKAAQAYANYLNKELTLEMK